MYEAFGDPFQHPGHPGARGRGPRGHGPRGHGHGGPQGMFGGPGGFFPEFDEQREHLRQHLRGGRQRKGDVRAAVLALLAERAMHGYEVIKEITARSGGFWRPSPGSVYPTLQMLADEGLVESEDKPGGRKLYSLTEQGRAESERTKEAPPWESAIGGADPKEIALRQEMRQLWAAMRQVSLAASTEQKERAARILATARRDLYAILAETGTAEAWGEE